ncbi:hypothetical protein Ngar_c08000 [Candidatus Nitrososphaera gargensis Ga9.2]|uniref:Uncharacterized protein n=1 Tax=Nitrososphaera gargensis (strain Ga9.2) TaxID=1237085 RepID=K0IIA6_NITGG|nr:hypothetical protein Ngar_c08000 [Candidatus Nitrososphaera gargensis Ga9.2]
MSMTRGMPRVISLQSGKSNENVIRDHKIGMIRRNSLSINPSSNI